MQDHHHHNQRTEARQQCQPYVAVGEAGHQVAHYAAAAHQQCVGQLGGHVLHVHAARARTGQDGGVGDGRAVVAHDAAAQGGGQGDDQQMGADGRGNRYDDGDQDAEGAPGCAGGKAEERGHHKHDDGQQAAGDAAGDHHILDVDVGFQQAAHAADGPGQHQNGGGGDHVAHAGADAFHELFKGHQPAGHILQKCHKQRGQRAPAQRFGRHAVAQRRRELIAERGVIAPEAADVQHAQNGEHNQRQNGHQHVGYAAALFALGEIGFLGLHRAQIAGLASQQLGFFHGAELHVFYAQNDHHDQRQQCVQVEGNGGAESHEVAFKAAGSPDVAADRRRPGRNGGDDAHRRGRGVDDVSQFCTGYIITVRHGLHDRTDGQAVEIVVNEDQAAQRAGGKQSRAFGAQAFAGPFAVGTGTAGQRDQMHQCAQQKAEQQNVNVDTGQGGVEQGVHRAHQRVETRHGGVDDGARQNADEQRGNNLFRDESQYDGKDRRQQ